jgi:multidrug efflux pump subunit AcrA (membrane-fusion protein)
MPTPEVNVVKVAAQTVPLTRELVGRLASSRVAEVRARVAGIILKQVYTEGTDVKAGQVLFQIDPAPLRAALHAQEAALARAQADADNAGDIARRYTDLHAKNLISRQDLDNALATQRTTAAVVKQAEANLETAQLNLGYATVTAPIAGRAGRAQVTEGALVGQGEATVLTRIEQIDLRQLQPDAGRIRAFGRQRGPRHARGEEDRGGRAAAGRRSLSGKRQPGFRRPGGGPRHRRGVVARGDPESGQDPAARHVRQPATDHGQAGGRLHGAAGGGAA